MNADFVSDIAVVKIQSKIPLPAAKLGMSSKLHPGDFVIALGCPHALKNTITSGIIRYFNIEFIYLFPNFYFIVRKFSHFLLNI